MKNCPPNPEIVQELYRSFVLLGADFGILGTIGSWGDSLPEAEVLASLKAWNAAMAQQIKERTEHYEISFRPLADSRDASPERSDRVA